MSLRRRGLRALVLGGLAALMAVAFGAASAWAEPSTYCVKATKVLTPKKHFTGGFNDKGCTSVNATHEGKFEKLASFTAPEEAQLKALLKYMTVQAKGIGGQPTVKLTGANLQVASGPKEDETNGTGNVVIGANERPEAQTGSNNLVLGEAQEFTSYGGIVAGFNNHITAQFASVTGGIGNIASGDRSSVSGGEGNTASGVFASVTGGNGNIASGTLASIAGGIGNEASGIQASVNGGKENIAKGPFASVSGGLGNKSEAEASSVGGGFENTANKRGASVSGGQKNTASGELSSISGGEKNLAGSAVSSISGGGENTILVGDLPFGGYASWIGGGFENKIASKGLGEVAEFAAIFGGKNNETGKFYEAIP